MFDLGDTFQGLHLAFTGHILSPAALSSIEAEYNENHSLDEIAKNFAINPLSWIEHDYIRDQHLSAIGVVDDLYTLLFDRSGEAEGIWVWSDQYLAGKSIRNLVLDMIAGAQGGDAVSISRSAEENLRSSESIVNTSYINLLNRMPDEEGFNNWVDQLNAGMNIGDFLQNFIAGTSGCALDTASLERTRSLDAVSYGAGFSDLSSFLNGLYENLFGRSAEPEGLAVWSDRIRSDGYFVGAVRSIIQSASNSDMDVLRDKLTFANHAIDVMGKAGMANPPLSVASFASQLINAISPNGMSVESAQFAFRDFVNDVVTESARPSRGDKGEEEISLQTTEETIWTIFTILPPPNQKNYHKYI